MGHGYKIFIRYSECELDALKDHCRRLYRYVNQLPFQIEHAILGIKWGQTFWGTPKIRDKLLREYPMIKPPLVPEYPLYDRTVRR